MLLCDCIFASFVAFEMGNAKGLLPGCTTCINNVHQPLSYIIFGIDLRIEYIHFSVRHKRVDIVGTTKVMVPLAWIFTLINHCISAIVLGHSDHISECSNNVGPSKVNPNSNRGPFSIMQVSFCFLKQKHRTRITKNPYCLHFQERDQCIAWFKSATNEFYTCA